MKRFTFFVILLIAALSLYACGGAAPEQPAPAEEEAPAEEAAPAEEETPAEAEAAPTEEEAPAEEEAETAPAEEEAPAEGEAAADGAAEEVELASELSVYNWADYIDEEVITTYEEEHGVDIIYDTFASNEDLLAKLQAGASG